MFGKSTTVMVELTTAKGTVFSSQADGVELRTTDGVIAINPREESYLNVTQTMEITPFCGSEFHSFVLRNAPAYLRDGKLTVLAQTIRPGGSRGHRPATLAPTNAFITR